MNTESIAPNRRILIIDDNESIHQDFRKILNPSILGRAALAAAAAALFGPATGAAPEAVFEIDCAFQGKEGLDKVRDACAVGRPFAMAFVDIRMPPGWDGIETIGRIWREYPELQVVICTAHSDYSLGQIVEKLGRTDRLLILKKPFDAIEVLQFADALTEKWRLGHEALATIDNLEDRVAERTRELREQQQQLIEARKMELVGKLAGGIAQDFNALMTAIIGQTDLIRQVSPEGQIPCRSAKEIAEYAVRAAALTHQLLGFGRRQALKLEPVDVNAAVRGLAAALHEIVGRSIEVSTAAGARNPWARADAGQLQKVLFNLVENARDAMPHGGKLTVETAEVTLEASAEVNPGDYLMIAISDTGEGIPDSLKPHIFEPYVTTKMQGAGKGLGLAMCQGIIKQSGGHIGFHSKAGRGATFKVYLPRFEGEQPAAAQDHPLSTAGAAWQGPDTILIVEADAALGEMAGDTMEALGYIVHRAANCREAISISGRLARLDLLVIDDGMPEMTGVELAQWLRALHPRMKVIFAETTADAPPDSLRKPYTVAALAARVREELAGESARRAAL